VQVIAHEDEGEQYPAAAQHRAPQVVEKPFTVLVVLNDLLAAVSPGHQVIDGPLEFDPQSPGHPASGAHGSDGVSEKPKTKSDPGGIWRRAFFAFQL